MKVLVACEFSGVVAQAFRDKGHDAWSADLLPSEVCNNPAHISEDGDCCGHYIGDVRNIIKPEAWDLMIAHPPCTYLAVSGARWFRERQMEQADAIKFVAELLAAPVPRIALENPIGVISTRIRKPDQIIQPWQFGHGETKATCLWLKELPPLKPTKIVEGRKGRVWYESPSPERWKNRSRTLQGIANAMADQWGDIV